jgi:hypothetical protein
MRMIGSKWENPNWSTSRLTESEGAPDRNAVKAGMAHFANSGPFGETCGNCRHLSAGRCAMFKKLTGRRGETISKKYAACKYFAKP